MKKSLSGVMLFNIIIIFLITVFALLSATLSYAKTYKVNTRMVSAIEKYEGYNTQALAEINRYLGNLGYISGGKKDCAAIKKLNGKVGTLVTNPKASYYYCVYRFDNYTESLPSESGKYYSYAVVTYISIDLPIVNNFKIPITAKTNRIYDFN